MLYAYCAEHGVPHRKIGKLVVATNDTEIKRLDEIYKQAQINGCENVELIDAAAAQAAGAGGVLRRRDAFAGDRHHRQPPLHAGAARRDRGSRRRDRAQHADRAAGAGTGRLGGAFRRTAKRSWSMRWSMPPGSAPRSSARATEGYPQERVPKLVFAKGNYFSYSGRPVFKRLIYPAPIPGGLGVHVTLDLAGRMRFGPDVEWIERGELRRRSRARGDVFYASASANYWPGLPDNSLVPGLCRHPAEDQRAGRAAARFHDRRAQGPRRAAAGACCSASSRRG